MGEGRTEAAQPGDAELLSAGRHPPAERGDTAEHAGQVGRLHPQTAPVRTQQTQEALLISTHYLHIKLIIAMKLYKLMTINEIAIHIDDECKAKDLSRVRMRIYEDGLPG
jgi:hypothetical protein